MAKGGKKANPGAVTLALVVGAEGKGPDVDENRLDEMLEQVDGALPAHHVGSVLAHNAHNPRWNLLLSWMLLRRGRADEAARVLEKVALLDPADDSVFQTLALAIERSGDPALGREIRRHMERWEGEQTLCSPPPAMPGDQPPWWSPTIVTAQVDYVDADPSTTPIPASTRPEPASAATPSVPSAPPAAGLPAERSSSRRRRSRSMREKASIHDGQPPAEGEGRRRPFEKETRIDAGGPVAREQVYPRPNVEPQRRLSWRTAWLTLAVASIVGLLLLFGSKSVPPLFDDDARIRELLAAGNLQALAETVPAERVDEPSSQSAAALADAVLYRFFDADLIRRDRLERAFAASPAEERPSDGTTTIARALLVPAVERFDLLSDLLTLERTPLVLYLIATTMERAGETDRARDVWEELAALEHLPLYLAVPTADHLQRAGPIRLARRVLETSKKAAATDDPWRVATNTRARSALAPVVSAEMGLRRALEVVRGVGQRGVREARSAARSVNGQRALLLDFFERLMRAGHRDAAAVVLDEIESTDSPAVIAARGRLLVAAGDAHRGRRQLLAAWAKGLHDPRVGLLLSSLPVPRASKGGDKRHEKIDAREILEPLLNRWPGNHQIALAYAQVLVDRGASAQAIELLRERLSWIQRSAPADQRAGAYYTLARAEQSRGQRGRAIKHLEDALASDPSFDPAKKLRRALR